MVSNQIKKRKDKLYAQPLDALDLQQGGGQELLNTLGLKMGPRTYTLNSELLCLPSDLSHRCLAH